MRMLRKPSKTPSLYTTFAASRFLNREYVLSELEKVVRILKIRCPDVEAVYLFGSLVSGIPTPKSDADLLVVVEEHDADMVRELLSSAPLPVDVFIFSPKSFRKKITTGRGIAAFAVSQGIRLV